MSTQRVGGSTLRPGGIRVDLKRDDPPVHREFHGRQNLLDLFKIRADAARLAEITSPTTLAYARKWGVERIFLDGIQNHLPSDSGGTHLEVHLLVRGEWHPLKDVLYLTPQEIDGIMYADDGRGFPYDMLGELVSTKVEDENAVGENGEGLKMIGAAALRLGFDFMVRSRDWLGVARVFEKTIESQTIQKPLYDIYTIPRQNGSATYILRTGKNDEEFDKLAWTVLNGGKRVLLLRPDYSPLFKSRAGEVMDESGDIFVKGLFITDSKKDHLLFGYNLKKISANRDRTSTADSDLQEGIREVLLSLEHFSDIKMFLDKAYGRTDDTIDTTALVHARSTVNDESWVEAFYSIYKEKAVLASPVQNARSAENNRLAEALGYRVITFPPGLAYYLNRRGVKFSEEVVSSGDTRLVGEETYSPELLRVSGRETSISLEYRAAKWGLDAVVRDLLANHMPRDSGSTTLPVIDFQYTVGPNRKVLAIRVTDNGCGYDESVLGRLYSTKKAGAATGQFGEGLDMSAATILRIARDNALDLQVRFRSRGWAAMPFATHTTIAGNPVGILNYKIATGLQRIEGSTTTLFNPPEELVALFQSLGSLALPFNPDHKVLHHSAVAQLFDGTRYGQAIPTGTVFVQDFRVSTALAPQMLFSYNLDTRDVSPDRDQVNPEVVKTAVADLIRSCMAEGVIRKIIQAASQADATDYFEFVTLEFPQPDNPQALLYKKIFHDIYGPRAVLASDSDPFVQAEAIHWGTVPIKLHPSIRQTLLNAGVMTDADVARENFTPRVVPYNNLTRAEKAVLDRYKDIDRILGLKNVGRPIIFDQLRLRDGTIREGIAGYYQQGGSDPAYIRRDQLANLPQFTEVYTHERGHEITRRSDPEDGFREFFERRLSTFVLERLRNPTDSIPPAELTAMQEQVRMLAAQLDSLSARLQDQSLDTTTQRIRAIDAEDEVARLKKQLADIQNQLSGAQKRNITALREAHWSEKIVDRLRKTWTDFFTDRYSGYVRERQRAEQQYLRENAAFRNVRALVDKDLEQEFPPPWYTRTNLWDISYLPPHLHQRAPVSVLEQPNYLRLEKISTAKKPQARKISSKTRAHASMYFAGYASYRLSGSRSFARSSSLVR